MPTSGVGSEEIPPQLLCRLRRLYAERHLNDRWAALEQALERWMPETSEEIERRRGEHAQFVARVTGTPCAVIELRQKETA